MFYKGKYASQMGLQNVLAPDCGAIRLYEVVIRSGAFILKDNRIGGLNITKRLAHCDFFNGQLGLR